MPFLIDGYPIWLFWALDGGLCNTSTTYVDTLSGRYSSNLIDASYNDTWPSSSTTLKVTNLNTSSITYRFVVGRTIASPTAVTTAPYTCWGAVPLSSTYDSNYMRWRNNYYKDDSTYRYMGSREGSTIPLWSGSWSTYDASDYRTKYYGELTKINWSGTSDWSNGCSSSYCNIYTSTTFASPSKIIMGDGVWLLLQAGGGGGGGADVNWWGRNPGGGGGGGGAAALVYLNCRKLYQIYSSAAYFTVTASSSGIAGGTAGTGNAGGTAGGTGATLYLKLVNGSSTTTLLTVGGGGGGAWCAHNGGTVSGGSGGTVSIASTTLNSYWYLAANWSGGAGGSGVQGGTGKDGGEVSGKTPSVFKSSFGANDECATRDNAGGGGGCSVGSTYNSSYPHNGYGGGGGGGAPNQSNGYAGGQGFIAVLNTYYNYGLNNVSAPDVCFNYKATSTTVATTVGSSTWTLYKYSFIYTITPTYSSYLVYRTHSSRPWRGLMVTAGTTYTIQENESVSTIGARSSSDLKASHGEFLYLSPYQGNYITRISSASYNALAGTSGTIAYSVF